MKANNRVHGRRPHRPPGGCGSGRTVYATKADAERAGNGRADRCGRCRHWHADDDRPNVRRPKNDEGPA